MMKSPGRKAQAAIEYIQTYGWAILVVMVVGVALWQFGIFGPQSAVNTASGFSKIKILEPTIKYEGNILNFTLVNGAGMRARISNTRASGSCTAILVGGECVNDCDAMPRSTCCGVDDICCNSDACGARHVHVGGISVGVCYAETTVTLDQGDTRAPDIVFCDDLPAGKPFEVFVEFDYYTKLGTDLIYHTDGGVIRGFAE